MASIASWADDIRTSRKNTSRWHFADMPIAENKFGRARDCELKPAEGDCVVAELERLRNDLRCAPTDDAKRGALQFAVHFLGDIHQPLHVGAEYFDEQGRITDPDKDKSALGDEGGNTFTLELIDEPPRRRGIHKKKFHGFWDYDAVIAMFPQVL